VGFGWATVYEYKPGVPALDSAFVTPLVVTQLLNLFLKNYLPHWLRKKQYRLEDTKMQWPSSWFAKASPSSGGGGKPKAKALRRRSPPAASRSKVAATVPYSSVTADEEEQGEGSGEDSSLRPPSLSPAAGSAAGSAAGQGCSPCGENGLSSSAGDTAAHKLKAALLASLAVAPAAEAALIAGAARRALVRADSGDSNCLTSRAVIRQSQLPEWSCFDKYLSIVIQFSYITMFSIVWPLVGCCAVGNNW
jgi:hypothetical protein